MDRFFKDLFLRTLMNIVNFKKIVVILKFSVRNGEATEINLMALTNKKGEEIFFFRCLGRQDRFPDCQPFVL